jgi:hypothetical protein
MARVDADSLVADRASSLQVARSNGLDLWWVWDRWPCADGCNPARMSRSKYDDAATGKWLAGIFLATYLLGIVLLILFLT